jgi:hypothetical protein
MNILRTARVVIIEDDDSEAMPLLRVLSKLGIGAWHFTGNAEELPSIPVQGVRLLFVDLRLGDAGVGGEPRHKFAQTISVLDKIVGASKGIVGLVFWTKNEEDIASFQEQLLVDLPNFVPAFVEQIGDKLQFVGQLENTGTSLFDRVNKILGLRPASQLLFEWEQVVHDATSATTNRLAELADGEPGDTHDCLMKILSALAVSTGASTDLAEPQNVSRLFESLNPIHSDHLEQLTLRRNAADASSIALKTEIQKQEVLSEPVRAAINGFILTARVTSGDPFFQPGAVFVPQPNIGVKCPHHHASIPLLDLCSSVLQYTKNGPFNEAYTMSRSKKLPPEKQEEGAITCRQIASSINDDCKKILIEISPACDFAQRKRSTARFVGGLLVPEKHFALIRTGEYLCQIEPLLLNELGGVWIPVINSRYLFGIAAPEVKLESRPLFRLRNPLLVDLLAWIGSQAARPGYVLLEKP